MFDMLFAEVGRGLAGKLLKGSVKGRFGVKSTGVSQLLLG